MYTYIDGNLAISVDDWCEAGLTYNQFRVDRRTGKVAIAQRSINGKTLIWVDSIKRPDRMRAIEAAFGKAKPTASDMYDFTIDTKARDFFAKYTKPDGTPLESKLQTEYTNRASLMETLKNALRTQINSRATGGKKLKMCDWYKANLQWYITQCTTPDSIVFGTKPYTNVRTLERAFKAYCKEGYTSLLSGKIGNDQTRLVNRRMNNLFLNLWRTQDKPFVHRVWELYNEFLSGVTEIFDKETGEVYNPNETDATGTRIFHEVSEATIWNYLKDVVNNTAVYSDRNGNFDYANKLRPKHHRKLGKYSLSKISMDDVALSRKSTRSWVYKYIAVDVVSGYYFRPAYVVGKPNEQTVYESFRNMFCELAELGLPMPGELEVEHHLMSNIPWLGDVFSFTRFCQSPTEKRAEHNIKSLKWGSAKDMGHTRGRWYAKHEAYRCVRNKVDGDYTEPTEQPQTIVADDLADIERHNNELHPLQKTFPGMTRRDVLMKCYNPDLQPIEPSYLLQFIGNETETSIRNNDYCAVNNEEFELVDFNALRRLKPNNYSLMAYWLPEADGSVKRVYLYQDGIYVGEAVNRGDTDYNECAIERTDTDRDNMLHQEKRAAKFDKFVKERRAELTKIGRVAAEQSVTIAAVPTDIVLEEHEQPANYEADEFTTDNYAEMAINSL